MASIRVVLLPFLLFLAGAAIAQPMGYDDARHLLNRTGFGATDAEVRDYAKLSRLAAVDRLLGETRREAATPPPAFVKDAPLPYYKLRAMDVDAKKAELRRNVEQGLELREWWFGEMLASPSPFTERLTLFWHNHFATGQQKVRSPQLMYRQNVLLRREAAGNFGVLLHGVAKDPAMLVYLDNANSRRKAPNENFAREVMELFTVGEGRYSEADVKEAARAFTGWSLDRETLEFSNRRLWHDGGTKTVLGKTGRFDGDDVLDILLERPETGRFIVGKLWREFVSPEPDAKEVERLAAAWREARHEMKPLLRAMFVSDAFWSPANRASLIKSPVDLVVGTLRTFDIHPISLRAAVVASTLLGQNPMSPPNVKGWPGGEAWINSSTLLGRKQLLERLFRGSDAMAPREPATMEAGSGREQRLARQLERGMRGYAFDAERWSRDVPAKDAARLVLAAAAVNPVPADSRGLELARTLTADPAYQLR